MVKVKGFSAFAIENLERKINQFIAHTGCKVVEIKHAVSIFECTALVMYEETASNHREE